MKKALILHAWFDDSKAHWYPWLKAELVKKGYEVYAPDLPTMKTDVPSLDKIMDFINKNFQFDKDTIVFGHSLGCLVGLRLAERNKFNKLFIVAGWDFNDLTEGHKLFWKTGIDHAVVKRNVKEIYVVSSDNDPYITAAQAEDMSKRLSAKFVLVKKAGHFTKKFKINKIPQIIKFV